MPYDVKRFIFSVSLCAMLAVNPVLATAPGETESVGTAHTVYDVTKLNKATNGIAGVGYVNRMVDAAGNAATAAEAHAAAAGAHALSAAQSADEAHKVLADKVNIDQGADKKNLAMVTDNKGTVYPGYVAPGMIVGGSKIDNVYTSSYSGFVLWSDHDGNVSWKTVDDEVLANDSVRSNEIADGAVTSAKIANKAVTAGKIANGAVTSAAIADRAVETTKIWSPSGITTGVLVVDGSGMAKWGLIRAGEISGGAVTTTNYATGSVDAAALARDSVSTVKIIDGAVKASKISVNTTTKLGQALVAMPGGTGLFVGWGNITSNGIADGAVTIDKTAGVVGMVPVGSADATTYGQFWIE